MPDFDKDQLVDALPLYIKALPKQIPPQVDAYLAHYKLRPLTEKADYRIGYVVIDNSKIILQSFQQPLQQSEPATARGTIVLVHGYLDHLGLYRHLIEHLLDQGLNVVGYDLSGHGLSAGAPWDIDDFHHYATQLQQVIAVVAEQTTQPIHLIGQSTGAAIITTYRALYQDDHNASGSNILLAPLVRPTMWRAIKRRYQWLRLFLRRVPRRHKRNSHNQDFLDFIAHRDPLKHDSIPVNWVGAMLRWGDWLEQQPGMPACAYLIQGTADSTVDWSYNLPVLEQLYAQLEVQLIEEAKHHLINESEPYLAQVLTHISSALMAWEKEQKSQEQKNR